MVRRAGSGNGLAPHGSARLGNGLARSGKAKAERRSDGLGNGGAQMGAARHGSAKALPATHSKEVVSKQLDFSR